MSIGNTRRRRRHRQSRRRPRGRARPGDLRPIEITLGVQKWAEGSRLIRFGDTQVLCAATIEDRVPPHLRGKGTGWVTGTYEMLPRATAERSEREAAKGKIGGRTHEIQRLVGRSLRGVVDLSRLGERTITVDCDVLVADGGTRTASITGGYVALAAALITYGMDRHLVGHVAAVSVGIVDGRDVPRPRLLRGLARRGRLQRRRHGRGRVRRAPGHGRGQAVRPARRWTAARPRERRARAGCSRRRPRRSPRSAGSRRWRGTAAACSSRRAPRTSSASCASCSASGPTSSSCPPTTWASRASPDETGDHVRDERRDQGAGTRRARSGLPTLADDSGPRGRRAGRRRRASARGATPVRTRPTRTTTRSSWARWTACRPTGAARATCACSRSRCRARRGRAAGCGSLTRRGTCRGRIAHAPRGTRRLRLRPDLRAGVGAAGRADARASGPPAAEARDLASVACGGPHVAGAAHARVLAPAGLTCRPDDTRRIVSTATTVNDVNTTNSEVHQIGEHPFDGTQHGRAILYVNGADGTISGTKVYDFQKNGIEISGLNCQRRRAPPATRPS